MLLLQLDVLTRMNQCTGLVVLGQQCEQREPNKLLSVGIATSLNIAINFPLHSLHMWVCTQTHNTTHTHTHNMHYTCTQYNTHTHTHAYTQHTQHMHTHTRHTMTQNCQLAQLKELYPLSLPPPTHTRSTRLTSSRPKADGDIFE